MVSNCMRLVDSNFGDFSSVRIMQRARTKLNLFCPGPAVHFNPPPGNSLTECAGVSQNGKIVSDFAVTEQ